MLVRRLRAAALALALVPALLLGGVLGGVGASAAPAGARDVGRVLWDDDVRGTGGRLAALWPGIVEQAEAQLGVTADLTGAEVIVVSSLARLRERARADVPGWAAGVTVGGQRVVLRTDTPSTLRASLEQTLRHEAVHLVWARHAGLRARRLPRWFEEGLAELIGGGVTVDAGARFEVAAAHDRLLEFRDLAGGFPADAYDADLAYQQSQRLVGFVVQEAGWPAVRATLAALLRQDGPASQPGDPPDRALDLALREATGRDLGAWTAAWRHSLLERRSRWWLWLVSDVGGVVMLGMALLGLALFTRVRRRRRRQIEALPDEPEPRSPADSVPLPPGEPGDLPGAGPWARPGGGAG